MEECVIVPTYKRDELLFGCLLHIRYNDPRIPIFVFTDRETGSRTLIESCHEYNAKLIFQPKHSYYGNSFSAGEALRFAFNSGFELIHYIEDDAFIKEDFFPWTRDQHELWKDIFCTCGWVFNREAPLADETLFAPWIYIPQFSIRREKLLLVLPHLNPLYYGNMKKYIAANFKDNPIKDLHSDSIQHFEIDGLLQRIIMQHNLQVAWPGIGKIKHMGFGGYNQGWGNYEDFFAGCADFAQRVTRVGELSDDPYWRARFFGREIVEREDGQELPERLFRYKIKVGEFESDYTSDLLKHQLPRVINSVPLPKEAEIVLQ